MMGTPAIAACASRSIDGSRNGSHRRCDARHDWRRHEDVEDLTVFPNDSAETSE